MPFRFWLLALLFFRDSIQDTSLLKAASFRDRRYPTRTDLGKILLTEKKCDFCGLVNERISVKALQFGRQDWDIAKVSPH